MDLILQLALVLLAANICKAVSIKLKIPPVILLMLLGVVLGPSLLNYLKNGEIVEWIANVGILFLIFEAGIQTNVAKLKTDSKKAVLPALGGIILPFITGFLLSYFFKYSTLTSLFVGAIFTATSISISVVTLIDINKLKSIEGRCIVNSAIIDDILGILIISVIFGLSTEKLVATTLLNNNLIISIVKIILFFAVSFLAGIYLIPTILHNSKKLYLENFLLSISIIFIFIYAWFAELLGLAAITGAYFAGIFIGQSEYKHTIDTGISLIGKSLFVDIFFISVGLGVNLRDISIKPLYLILFIVLAIFSKIIGSAFGARLSKFDMTRSLRIGFGMVPRGEIALIIATMGISNNVIPKDILSATILMIIVTSIVAPILIKFSFSLFKKETF